MRRLLCCMAIFLFVFGHVYADEERQIPERYMWDKKPIQISLTTGQERVIHFPADIRYWIPDIIQSSVTALSANGVLYITATEPFAKTRIRIQELDNNRVYLLDIKADEIGGYSHEIIIINKEDIINQSKMTEIESVGEDWYAKLTRFAAQRLYAPESAIEPDEGIKRIKLKHQKPVRLIRGGSIEAIPWVAWQGGPYYITAIRLRNVSQQPRTIDPRSDIRGRWLVATLQHTWIDKTAESKGLDKAGSDKDTTTLYLISPRRFEEMFNG